MLLIFIILSLIITVFLAIIYNKIVSNRNHVKDAWSNIDVFLKKRYEIIPTLVNTAKGYAQHEKNTFELITKARTKAMLTPDTEIQEKAQAEQDLSKLMEKIVFIQENYPELKADFSFLKLQEELAKLELDLEKSRRYYNVCVRENNTYGESFPAVLFVKMFGYKQYEFFTIKEKEKDQREVDF